MIYTELDILLFLLPLELNIPFKLFLIVFELTTHQLLDSTVLLISYGFVATQAKY